MKKVLVISVHPDDETLGCGGAILKHKDNGEDIFWLIITNVNTNNGWEKEVVISRQAEIDKVSSIFGFNQVFKLDFPATKLDEIPFGLIVQKVREILKDVNPTTIYLNNRSDIHSEHKIAFQAIMSCVKNFRLPSVERILMYECLSETEFAAPLPENAFIPNVFVDITTYMDKKLEIMSVYKSEVMPGNLPRSYSAIKALAAYRGSRIGVDYAEAFMLLHEKA